MQYHHQPVMLSEVLEILDPKPGEYFLDATLGGAGYILALSSEAGEQGRILALDMDPEAIRNAEKIIKERNIKNVVVARSNFKDLKRIAKDNWGGDIRFNGVVFDLGLSSFQLQDEKRGFSFKGDTRLDMSFEGETRTQNENTTEKVLNDYSVEELERIFKKYGEERLSLKIAKNIAKRRQEYYLQTSGQVEKIIEEAVPNRLSPYKNNIKARIFQALRIFVNEELENLSRALPEAMDVLEEGGVIVVISYHSLEDRLVKDFFDKESRDCVCPPELPECRCGHRAGLQPIKHKRERGKTKKFLTPTSQEIENNPRSRSAKLRAAKKNN